MWEIEVREVSGPVLEFKTFRLILPHNPEVLEKDSPTSFKPAPETVPLVFGLYGFHDSGSLPQPGRLFIFHVNEGHALLHTAASKVLHDPLP